MSMMFSCEEFSISSIQSHLSASGFLATPLKSSRVANLACMFCIDWTLCASVFVGFVGDHLFPNNPCIPDK